MLKYIMKKNVLGKRRQIYKQGKIIGKQGLLYKVKTNLGEEMVPRYKLSYLI